MLKLGVNIDHVATIRQARYKGGHEGAIPEPNPVWAAVQVELAGAHGITVHLREDRRHMQDRDIRLLRQTIRTNLNLEMADVPEIVAFAEEVKPDEACLVPEKRTEVTTEGGLDVRGAFTSLKKTVARLHKSGIAVSMFIDADETQIKASADLDAEFIELHTGRYGNARGEIAQAAEIKRLTKGAVLAHKLGLRVNAGHGLNYQNTPGILAVPHLETLNTGHSIISRSIFVGLHQAVREMLELMKDYGRA
ncbi:MAG: pyridoxine 5'-phosphate synthase [Verrucomicrobiae bacterium]|nr:pyridoxine 5'-phosphate synthase [Verrucomicrobiae bacterium]